ncbi:MAG: hypothetical protein DDT26_02303 [Dehalococcoidia bacterium]|nr:hypothetical protein [Chloroflexota bacterium]
MEIIEGVKNALLSLLFAGDEMNVVNEEHICTSILIAKTLGALLSDAGDEVVGELFRGGIDHLLIILQNELLYGMQQVGLPQPHPAIDEQRVINAPRVFRHPQSGGVGQPIAAPHDERGEGIFGVERVVISRPLVHRGWVIFCLLPRINLELNLHRATDDAREGLLYQVAKPPL